MMKAEFRWVAAILCLLLFAAGCGQKGPLFLPGDPDEAQTEIPGQAPGDTAEDEQEQTDRDSTDRSPR